MKSDFYLGLVHSPILNKRGKIVTTSVTNLDIHDIARSCKTFGVKNYYIITPLKAQHELLDRLLGHWEEDKANLYNPDRQNALSIIKRVDSIEDAAKDIKNNNNSEPTVCVTGAGFKEKGLETISSNAYREKIDIDNKPNLLLFGTGWGLTPEWTSKANLRLDSINGPTDYNHLSVRSAVAIYLSRIFSV